MAIFRRNKDSKPSTTIADVHQPLIWLLHAYVLDCISELSLERQNACREVVRQVYGGNDDWKVTLRSTLRLSSPLDDSLRGMWERNQQTARLNNMTLSSDEFAEMIVQSNFVPMLR